MSELCRSLHFLPERPPFYERSLKKTEFLEDVASQGYNFKWRVMVRFLCKPIIFLTFPLKTQLEVFFSPSVFQKKRRRPKQEKQKNKAKYTNKSTTTKKSDRRSMWNRIVSVWFGIGKTLVFVFAAN